MTLSFLKLYLTSKIEELDKRSIVLHSSDEMSELVGKIELIEEMWRDLGLNNIDKTETITFHNQI